MKPAKDIKEVLDLPSEAQKAEMPGMIKPMLAELIDEPFDDKEWIFELKWDGYRAIANIHKNKVLLYSRNNLEFHKYAAVREALEKLHFDSVLDGEVVAVNEDGVPKFQLLQQFEKDPDIQLQYMVFDVLYYNGYDLTGAPLVERKDFLKKIIPEDDPVIRYSDYIEEQGLAFFKEVEKQGLEGIMGKMRNSTYQKNKRSGAWVKIKTRLRQEAVICGYTDAKGSRKYFGSLILGVYNSKGELEWIGSSGGGFNDKGLQDIYGQLQPLETGNMPFKKKPPVPHVHWVKPELVCEVAFSEWTEEGSMRHPVFQGLRNDKDPKDVKREIAKHKKTK